ncbi:hypothetical protein, partial [Mycobacterium ostraviense]|uniref:hypothetical protein n=1 Tax=Mycobacterium ostraviense TaxID=2738409 RepID=UPI0015D46E69
MWVGANTGAFISGDGNNGFFWRGTGQGLIGADYTITIPRIPLAIGLGGILKLPITGDITGLTINPFTLHGIGDSNTGIPVNADFTLLGSTGGTTIHFDIPGTDLGFSFDLPSLPISIGVDVDDQLSPITVPRIRISPITFNDFVVGGDSTSLSADVLGGLGPVTIPVF